MNDETMAKLNEVAYDRLTMAMNNVDGSKEQTAFMKEAMDAIDRIIELEKLDDARKDKRDEKSGIESSRQLRSVELFCLSRL